MSFIIKTNIVIVFINIHHPWDLETRLLLLEPNFLICDIYLTIFTIFKAISPYSHYLTISIYILLYWHLAISPKSHLSHHIQGYLTIFTSIYLTIIKSISAYSHLSHQILDIFYHINIYLTIFEFISPYLYLSRYIERKIFS